MYSRFKNILFFIFDNNFLCDFVHRVKITFLNEYKVIQLLYPSCTVHFETIKLKFGEADYRITKIATEVGVTSIPMQLVNYTDSRCGKIDCPYCTRYNIRQFTGKFIFLAKVDIDLFR